MSECKVCGIQISNRRVYCSYKCKEKHRYNNTIYIKNCSICGEEFPATKGMTVCSERCSLNSQRKHEKLCPICKSNFNSRGNGIYCSDVCYRTANNPTKGFTVTTCNVCGEYFKTLQSSPEVVCSDVCGSKLFKTYINRTNQEIFGTTNRSIIRKRISELKKESY